MYQSYNKGSIYHMNKALNYAEMIQTKCEYGVSHSKIYILRDISFITKNY